MCSQGGCKLKTSWVSFDDLKSTLGENYLAKTAGGRCERKKEASLRLIKAALEKDL